MRVRKAVFPAAGWGTRFLPATKAQPKEMLPLVDKPIIQYAVEEAVAAGIEQVIIVTSSQKRAIEDHFDLSFELEHLLEEKGDIEMLRQVRAISDLAQVAYIRQKEQLGLGHAVLMAKDLIGHEPFAVILPDDVVVGDRPCIGQLIHAYHQHHGSVVAVMEVPPDQTSRYGVIGSEPSADPLDHGRLHRITSLVEKPATEDAPSNLAIIGRYVLTPKIFDKLEQTQRGAGGEIQLTDAIAALMEEQEVFGYEFEGTRYDAGTTMGWLQASVELALEPARPRAGVPRVPAGPPALTDRATQSPGTDRPLGDPCAASTLGRLAPGPGESRRRRGSRPGPVRYDSGRSVGLDQDNVVERGACRLADIGQILGGRYRLIELLGQGGMATIYRAARHRARPRRRPQAPSRGVPARPRFLVPVPAGGTGGRVAEPPERRHRLRLRRGSVRPVHRHGAGRRRGPGDDPAAERRAPGRARPPGSRPALDGPWRPPTPAGSSTATSSRATS